MSDWIAGHPKEPGVYAVKGFSLGNFKSKAVVEVAKLRDELVCNIHEVNSDRDKNRWFRVVDLNEDFKWKRLSELP